MPIQFNTTNMCGLLCLRYHETYVEDTAQFLSLRFYNIMYQIDSYSSNHNTRQDSFIHSFIQPMYIEHLLCVSLQSGDYAGDKAKNEYLCVMVWDSNMWYVRIMSDMEKNKAQTRDAMLTPAIQKVSKEVFMEKVAFE